MLQQENSSSNEEQQQKWKTQHLMHNFSKLCCNKETTEMNEILDGEFVSQLLK